jgi:hypothetical protein
MAHDGGLPPDVAALSDAELRAYRVAYAPFDAANEGFMCGDSFSLGSRGGGAARR